MLGNQLHDLQGNLDVLHAFTWLSAQMYEKILVIFFVIYTYLSPHSEWLQNRYLTKIDFVKNRGRFEKGERKVRELGWRIRKERQLSKRECVRNVNSPF